MRGSHFTILGVLLATVMCTGCSLPELTLTSPDGTESVTIMVEVADSPKERAEGLMKRGTLAENTGMLFVFQNRQMMSFWMKSTLIPLEIFFFDDDGSFVNALTMEPCTEDPCAQYKSAALAKYALEVNKGFREKYKIGMGWKIDVSQVRKMAKPT